MKSKWEELFTSMLTIAAIKDYKTEVRFHPTRMWRFDFCWPDKKVAVEIDGGGWSPHGGRHARTSDYEKRNEATYMGWKVYYYTPEMIKSGAALAQIINVLRS